MHPVDEKRIMREFELWLAKQGPDYSVLHKEIAAEKAYVAKGAEAARETETRRYLIQRYHPSEAGGREDGPDR